MLMPLCEHLLMIAIAQCLAHCRLHNYHLVTSRKGVRKGLYPGVDVSIARYCQRWGPARVKHGTPNKCNVS